MDSLSVLQLELVAEIEAILTAKRTLIFEIHKQATQNIAVQKICERRPFRNNAMKMCT